MRKIFLLLILVILGLFLLRTVKNKVRNDLAQVVPYPSVLPSPSSSPAKQDFTGQASAKSLFVPYWALDNEKIDVKGFDSLLYFGVTPGSTGIDKKEAGFVSMDKFISASPDGVDKQLVVRMVDSERNFAILKDSAKQNAVIKDSISIAKENGFFGVVLDLEVSAVPFDSLIKQINDFTSVFHTEAQKNNISFTLMFYGDSFYRLRPFDIKTLSKNADNFMIMSYDFSKSRGNPGPNFPLKGKEVYGYDLTKMTDDFLRFLPPDKTSIVFGLFGYDWEVDDKGNAVLQGGSKTYQQIKNEFLGNCEYKDCVVRRKKDSAETEIRYTDKDNKKHIIWFEDPESVELKQKFLQSRGINNFSYWAYSYF